MTKADFIAAATAAAQASSSTSGFPVGITVAQAALESAFGASELSRVANNYFGIKGRTGHADVEFPTIEYVEGAPVRSSARFAKYDSMLDCFRDRDRMLATLAAYRDARAAARDPEMFARALARHWATDPGYAEKILSVYREHGFAALDQSPVANSQSPAGS